MKTNEASRFLSLVLRHAPEKANLTLDGNGWADVDQLLANIDITFEQLLDIVANNDKKRFAFNADESKIRANQGHSVNVNLELDKVNPDFVLYHGTATQNVESIKRTGLNKGQRHHVHLAKDNTTAVTVGKRSGTPVLFEIDAPRMVSEGHQFYISKNGVYLIEHVPAKFIKQV